MRLILETWWYLQNLQRAGGEARPKRAQRICVEFMAYTVFIVHCFSSFGALYDKIFMRTNARSRLLLDILRYFFHDQCSIPYNVHAFVWYSANHSSHCQHMFITRVSEVIMFSPFVFVCLCLYHDVCPDDLTMKDWCHTNNILQVHCWGCLVVQVMFHALMTSSMTSPGHKVGQILKVIYLRQYLS